MVSSVFSTTEQKKVLRPLLAEMLKQRKKGKTLVVGIQGGQGTGKTTLVTFLQQELTKKGYKVQSFSIDDFYKPLKERQRLQKKYQGNPFYQISRGMPGTHRVNYLHETLRNIKAGKDFEIPIFDKSLHQAQGDVVNKTIKVHGRQDFVLFEGWCLGLPAVSLLELEKICTKNRINIRKLDPTLAYSKVILEHTKEYQPLRKFIDLMVMLTPDSSVLHKQWRSQQEQELKQRTGKGMTKKEIERFVELFLPLTYVCYEKIHPDITIYIDKNHTFYRMKTIFL